MARTKQSAPRSTGGRTPRRMVARLAQRKTAPRRHASKSRWHVWLISDRRGHALNSHTEYLVEYIVAPGKTEGSWQPRWLLEEDGFQEYLDLVDEYKMFGGLATFSECVSSRSDDFSQAIGASSDGRCAFHALAHAVRLLG
ncbi:Histone-fold [Phytophthora cactorum]|nr:Histone-fold [Phytophthora cactorum]